MICKSQVGMRAVDPLMSLSSPETHLSQVGSAYAESRLPLMIVYVLESITHIRVINNF